MNITVFGAGAWGTALASSLAAHHRVTLWARDTAQIEAMRATRHNQRYLPDVELPANLVLDTDFCVALRDAELLILAIPSAALRPTLQRILESVPLHAEKPAIVWLCKGFEAETALLPHQVASEILPADMPCGVLSGPSFALEVAKGLPTAVVLASVDEAFAQRTALALHHPRLRVYASTDITGVEVGGAVKNVMAIAAGVCDGMNLGNNARAALITRGLAEISRLGLKMGGLPETMSGLSGAGDLILTCTGDLSRNRRVGLLLAQQNSLQDILDKLGHVAEGVYAVREVYRLSQRLDVNMPICEAVYRVLYEHVPVNEMVVNLLNRAPNLEFS